VPDQDLRPVGYLEPKGDRRTTGPKRGDGDAEALPLSVGFEIYLGKNGRTVFAEDYLHRDVRLRLLIQRLKLKGQDASRVHRNEKLKITSYTTCSDKLEEVVAGAIRIEVANGLSVLRRSVHEPAGTSLG
jgi:hypothetical protein